MRAFSDKTVELATRDHVAFAFETLLNHLSGTPLPEPLFPDAHTALFVTWKVSARSPGEHPRLRGCIGILEPRQLHKALRDYTLTSALHDKRFRPVDLAEVPSLECTVSLLSCFESAAAWDDWSVGVHGLIIEFTDPDLAVRRSATFLPEVAAEQGWSRAECIDALIAKAGYRGRASDNLRGALQVVRYQSTTCTLSYDDFVEERGGLLMAAAAGGEGASACAMALA